MTREYKKQYEIDDKTTYHREYNMSENGKETYWGGQFEFILVRHKQKESVEYKREAGSLVVEFTRVDESNDWDECDLPMDNIRHVNIYTKKNQSITYLTNWVY